MVLRKLHLLNFKNIAEANLEFADKVNCFLGHNGAGKTNLLDAIYYLSFCKSYFNPIDSQNINHEEEFFMVEGNYEDEESFKISCAVKRNEKKRFKKNQKDYERLADHIGSLPLVMISPSDTELIKEGSEGRRKFLDGIISQYDKAYLDSLLRYNRALMQRNAMLKRFWAEGRTDDEALSIYDEQLHALGSEIHKSRKRFLKEYLPLFNEFYALISNSQESVGLVYQSHLNDQPLIDALAETRHKDYRAQYTTRGIHKDDLLFELGGRPLKRFGSQGQQKSFVIAMRLSQFDYLKRLKGRKPLLLLDDVFDKLDDNRVSALMQLVSEDHFGQIFITDANEERVPRLFAESHVPFKKFKAEAGEISEL